MVNTILKPIKKIQQRIKRLSSRDHLLDLISSDSVCVEIGVWRGKFSKKLLSRQPKMLHLVDPWKFFPEYGDRVYGRGQQDQNNQERMDKIYQSVNDKYGALENVELHRGTSEEIAPTFANDYFDFVYIDANHDYEFVKQDLALFFPKTKSGGYIVGDDYNYKRCPNGGPKRAVEEMLQEKTVELVSVLNNQFVLKKL